MNEWKNANVDANARKAFELATDIAWQFDDEKIRSAYVVFAAMNIPESAIFKAIGELNTQVVPDIDEIIQNRELFVSIFGEKAARKCYEEVQVQEQGREEEQEQVIQTPEEMAANEFAAKVIDVLNNVIGLSEDDVAELMVPVYSDKLEYACQQAYIKCRAMKMNFITLDAIVYCILQNKETSAYHFINNIIKPLGGDTDIFLQSMKMMANIVDAEQDIDVPVVIPTSLESCLENMNAKYTKGEETKILGRDKEKYKLFNVMSKKTKRNAALVGKPGVGKTAIMEAITQDIVNETCPKEFVGYTVLSLDINAMVAGTKYRGEFETKVALLKQFLEGTKRIILFVDEMHQMLGAGSSSEGTVDLSGSLKPILARDDVVFIGATTINEYNTILSRDGAFKRRFEVVMVNEPKQHELKPMIKAQIKSMEKHHNVKMPGDILDYIILCSNCFNFETCNPDKTLDLCDRSMAITKMAGRNTVTKKLVNKVYEEWFEMFAKISPSEIEAVAYHEVGHYIVTRLTKRHDAVNTTAISIVPSEDSLGVNVYEMTENVVSCDMEFVEAQLMSLLAGRVAQLKVTKTIDSGASSDLNKVKQFAKDVITKYGMDDEEYRNICILDDDVLSEKMADKINEKVNALIQRAYDKTVAFIDEHWSEVEAMAKYLIKKKIVTSDELDKFLAKK